MRAIILKKNVFQEGNEIVTMYSRELGKVRGFARAIKKPLSKLAFGLEQLFYSEVELSQTGQKNTITGAKPLNTFKSMRNNLQTVRAALYAVELLLKSTADQQPNEMLFDYFLSFLEHLDNHSATEHNCWNFFGWQVLALNGYQINLKNCAACGKDLVDIKSGEPDKSTEQIYFSNHKGGFICEACAVKISDSLKVGGDVYGVFSAIAAEDFEAQDKVKVDKHELQQLAKSFIEYILERDLKSRRFIV